MHKEDENRLKRVCTALVDNSWSEIVSRPTSEEDLHFVATYEMVLNDIERSSHAVREHLIDLLLEAETPQMPKEVLSSMLERYAKDCVALDDTMVSCFLSGESELFDYVGHCVIEDIMGDMEEAVVRYG